MFAHTDILLQKSSCMNTFKAKKNSWNDYFSVCSLNTKSFDHGLTTTKATDNYVSSQLINSDSWLDNWNVFVQKNKIGACY